jgi:hypothetical protein
MGEAKTKLEKIKHAHHNQFDHVMETQIISMIMTLRFYLNNIEEMTWTHASLLAAKGAGRGVSLARNLCHWILQFIQGNCEYRVLPLTRYTQFDTHALVDEDLSARIRLHLQTLDRNFCAQDIADFLASEEMQGCLGTKKQTVSLSTVHRWLNKYHRFTRNPSGMYVDGHEREDVVEWRQDLCRRFPEYERQMHIFDTNGDVVRKPDIHPMEQPLVLITHDESTFYKND